MRVQVKEDLVDSLDTLGEEVGRRECLREGRQTAASPPTPTVGLGPPDLGGRGGSWEVHVAGPQGPQAVWGPRLRR